MSARATRERLVLAKRMARVIVARGVVHEDDLPSLLGCGWDEARAAAGIAIQWRKIDRCAGFLVSVPPRDEGRRAA